MIYIYYTARACEPSTGWKSRCERNVPHCGCGLPFFKITPKGVEPAGHRFWYFPIEESISTLMRQKQFAVNRGQHRLVPQDFYTSEQAEDLRNKYPAKDALDSPFIDKEENSCIELGFDAFNPFNFAQWSTPILGFRYRDMPEALRQLRRFTRPVFIVAGPEKPKSMLGFLRPLVDELNKFGKLYTSYT